MKKLDRRAFMQQTGLAGLSVFALSLGANRAVADPDPPAGSASTATGPVTEADIHRFQFGGDDAFIIHDGALVLPSLQPAFVPEAKPAELQELLKKNFLPLDRYSLSVNVLVIKGKDGVTLFDSGAGKAFGPAMGKLGERPQPHRSRARRCQNHLSPTHGHADHIGGLVNDANEPAFSFRENHRAKTRSVDFWMSENPRFVRDENSPDETIKPKPPLAQRKCSAASKPSSNSRNPVASPRAWNLSFRARTHASTLHVSNHPQRR